jgi:tight adherence protein B
VRQGDAAGGQALGRLWRLAGRRPGHADVAGPGADGSWGGFAPPGDASTARGGTGGERPTAALLALGVGLVAAVVVAGLAAAVIVVVAGAAGALWARRRQRVAWRRRRQGQLPVALERLASALRGGASVPGALTAVGDGLPAPLGPELAALGHEADAGRAVTDVLDEWAAVHGDAGTRLAATALVLAAAVGAAPARAADGVAATLRERADLAAERRALGAQARMSAAVLSIAPVAFAAFLGTTDAAATRFLLGTPAGWACLAVGLSLDAAGAWWMARATRGDER